MKEEKVIVELDPYEEGAVITALNELRNKELEQQESTDFVDDLLLKILHAPQKKVRIKGVPEMSGDILGRGGATEQASFCRFNGETSKRSPRRRDEAR